MWYVLLCLFSVVATAVGLVAARAGEAKRLIALRARLRRQARSLERERQEFANERGATEYALATDKREMAEFKARHATYEDQRNENAVLKQDIFNLQVEMKKTALDQQHIQARQAEIVERTGQLASRYLDENVKWIGKSISPNNFAASKKRLLSAIDACRKIGFEIPEGHEEQLVADLKALFEEAVRKEFQREEQARIRERIREEQRLEREIQRELDRLERERAAIEAALQEALAKAEDQHSDEVESLKERLREAEERSQRAKSQAELTRAGHVYVISNIGAFGGSVFKIGMTRRLEPQERIKELASASVPFPFDVHMMVSCDDAPTLENALHKELHTHRVNKVNPRKEFFRTDIETIRGIVEKNHGTVEYVAEPEALQYHESVEMSEEDAAFVEETLQQIMDEEGEEEGFE